MPSLLEALVNEQLRNMRERALRMAHNTETLQAEIELLRTQVAELLPWAEAGANAMSRIAHSTIEFNEASFVLNRIRAGEFGAMTR